MSPGSSTFPLARNCFPPAVSLVVRHFLRYWLPVLLWAGLIFSASTDLGSIRHTSRFIGPTLRWLFPGISDDAVHRVQIGIRKSGHAGEYAILAGLVWRARYRPGESRRRDWSGAIAWQAWGAAAAYAISDEYHQSFYPSREGSVRDVMIDSAGAAAGMGLIYLWGRVRKWW